MDQLPPAPAQVSYEGGLLAISAQNSTLGEILRDVRKLTGAAIEIPPGPGANERVVTNLGPGEPRDVLAGLLNGSSFNYVMLGSSSDPGAVASILLTAKPSLSGEPAPNMANAYQDKEDSTASTPRFTLPFPVRAPGVPGSGVPGAVPPPGNAAAADSDDKDDDDKDDDGADDQAQGQPGQPNVTNPNADQQQSTDPNQPNAGPKTPEQILQMLRHPQPGSPTIPQQPPPD